MVRSIKKFAADAKGAFAIQFALLAIPLTVCTGLAIDGGRAFLARFELAAALDAAALAVGSTLQEGVDLDAIAAKFVERNFRTEHDEPIALELVPGDDTLILKGSVTIDTFFMPLIGQPYVTVAAESEVRRGGSNVEVALALDITGSMTTTRMDGLRSAANILIEEVVNPVQTPFFSKVAIVPWSQSVYTGPAGKHVAANAYEELRGNTLTAAKAVSGAAWRNSGTSTQTIAQAGWRTTTGARTIANAASNGTGGIDWRYGVSRSITGFTKLTGPARIQVTTSANHQYTDGQFVRITGAGGSYTGLNNNIYMVADKTNTTFNLRDVSGASYITPPTGSTSSTAASQRCHDSACNVGVTTSSAFTGLAAGDFVNITGASNFPTSQTPNYINNSDVTTWVVAAVPSTTRFTLANWNGPNFGTTMNSGGGSVSECLVSDCRYRVTTSGTHNFSTTDNVAIWNVTESGTGTSVNSALNTTWNVENPSGSVFYLPNNGKTYKDWTSGGSAAECALSSCNTRVTVANHGLEAGDFIELKSVGGMTGLNNPTTSVSSPVSLPSRVMWKVSEVNGDVLTLEDTSPAFNNMSNNYSSGGAAQCLEYGCAKFGFLISGGTATNPSHYRVYLPSPCLVERYGDDAVTDADPATAPLGINYTSNGDCTRTNYVTPLTADTTRLTQAITDLQTGGSTAGQLGIAWAWYMLSPEFDEIWDQEETNKPKAYEFGELAKVAILMTDGEFNFATVNGVPSASYGSGTRINQDPENSPFEQAQAICDAMKEKDIIIYTVGLELDTSLFSDDFLLACATSPEHAFLADDNTELENAFKDIAISISRLRIAR